MRGGVCCQRGRKAASVSASGPREGAVVEKAHAEVRTTRARWAGCAAPRAAVAVESRLRRGRGEAIGPAADRAG